MKATRVAIPAGLAGTRGAVTAIVADAADSRSPGDTAYIRNSGSVDVELGAAADVSAGQGYRLPAGASLHPLRLAHGESLHGAVIGLTAGALDVLRADAG